MRFEKEMKCIAFELETKYGFNILQCIYNEDNIEISDCAAERLIQAHYRKIDLSEGIYVVDINGYVGKSVQREIEYARTNDKAVI